MSGYRLACTHHTFVAEGDAFARVYLHSHASLNARSQSIRIHNQTTPADQAVQRGICRHIEHDISAVKPVLFLVWELGWTYPHLQGRGLSLEGRCSRVPGRATAECLQTPAPFSRRSPA